MTDYTATYSPEDNKLRLYAAFRLDDELYQRIREAGFRWAPKQDLFVAPMWTPEREDLLIELAGEIEPEGTTLAERAEAKAERLDGYRAKRLSESSSFHAAASAIGERFAMGQPILIGHHSQRKAEKDRDRMDSAMQNAIKAQQTANYWSWRAEGVERHANMKNCTRTRLNRIKKLLKEVRDMQRGFNTAYKALAFWRKVDACERSEEWAEKVKTAAGFPDYGVRVRIGDEWESLWHALDRELITPEEGVQRALRAQEAATTNPVRFRWLQHALNRLGYERSLLGDVPRFEGELTPVILQAFARTHGADKPKAKHNEQMGTYTLHSIVPLPAHLDPSANLQDSGHLELTGDQWRDLMQSVGYAVEIKEKREGKKQACSLINPTPEAAAALQALWNEDASASKYGKPSCIREMNQAYYSDGSKGDYSPFGAITLDQYGRKMWNKYRDEKAGRIPTCRVRVGSGGQLYSADQVIVLEDKPQKDLPTFEAKPEADAA